MPIIFGTRLAQRSKPMIRITSPSQKAEFLHKQTDDFKWAFRFQTTERTDYDTAALDLVFEIKKQGVTILIIEGADFTKTGLSQIVVLKDKSHFAQMSCLEDYTYRFYDRTSQSTFTEGPFKLS